MYECFLGEAAYGALGVVLRDGLAQAFGREGETGEGLAEGFGRVAQVEEVSVQSHAADDAAL